MANLTNMEGHLLAAVWRFEPTTAYFIRKSFERGPASDVSSSPGAVYPALKRLTGRGLIASSAAESDRRGTRGLSLTKAGLAAVKEWIIDIEAVDAIADDPMRTRMAFGDVLDGEDLLRWLRNVRRNLAEKLNELVDAAAIDQPVHLRLAYENARMLTQARISWIDLAIAELTSPGGG